MFGYNRKENQWGRGRLPISVSVAVVALLCLGVNAAVATGPADDGSAATASAATARAPLGATVVNKHGQLTIDGVTAASPAAQAGLQPDDQILRVNNRTVSTINEFRLVVQAAMDGNGQLLLEIRRNGLPQTIRAELAPLDRAETTLAARTKKDSLSTIETVRREAEQLAKGLTAFAGDATGDAKIQASDALSRAKALASALQTTADTADKTVDQEVADARHDVKLLSDQLAALNQKNPDQRLDDGLAQLKVIGGQLQALSDDADQQIKEALRQCYQNTQDVTAALKSFAHHTPADNQTQVATAIKDSESVGNLLQTDLDSPGRTSDRRIDATRREVRKIQDEVVALAKNGAGTAQTQLVQAENLLHSLDQRLQSLAERLANRADGSDTRR